MAGQADGPKRLVIAGGGAGGLELAIRLARLTRPGRRARVTLVDRRAGHIWKPRYHEIAAGLLVAAEEEAGYAALARRHGFDFELGEAARIDTERRELHLLATSYPSDDAVARAAGEPLLPARSLSYDVAVLATGSTVDDFGTPGVAEHCYTLDAAPSAERLHRAVLARAARVKAGLQQKLRVAIVGAGTTGVELAAELRNAAGRLAQYRSLLHPDQLDLILLEAAKRPLPSSPPAVSSYAGDMLRSHRVDLRVGAKVASVAAGAVTLEDGEQIDADLIVWVSGIKARPLATPLAGVRSGKGGRLATDPELRVLSEEGAVVEGLYAMGDLAAAPLGDEGSVPATAQAAHQQAGLLARSLARQLRGRPALPFRYHYKGTLVSLGERSAVGDLPGPEQGQSLRVSGAGAKLAYTGLYEAHLAELHGLWRTGALALGQALRRSAQPSVKLYW